MTERERVKLNNDMKAMMQNPNPTPADIIKAIFNTNSIVRADINALNETVKKIGEEQGVITRKVEQIEYDTVVMSGELSKLKSENEYLKQQQLINDIMITVSNRLKIPSVEPFVDKILDAYNIDKTEINTMFKKKQTDNQTFTQIVIRFKFLCSKEKLFEEKKKKGPLKVKQLFNDYLNTTDEIYIRERITAHNITLLKELNKLKEKGTIISCWFKNGGVYLKQNDNNKSQKINRIEDITTILN